MNKIVDKSAQIHAKPFCRAEKYQKILFNPVSYESEMRANTTELVKKCEVLQAKFPRTIEVFLRILKEHSSRHTVLEDWLLIRAYQLVWMNDVERLCWFESLFVELFEGVGKDNWAMLVAEIVQQTDCITTHHVCNRINDYLLHIYGAIYLIRHEWNVYLSPMQIPGPDIKASRGSESCIMECTFKHTSKKFDSLFWRFSSVCRIFFEDIPVLFSEQFSFPPVEELKELSSDIVEAAKEFIIKVHLCSKESHYGIFRGLEFEYHPALLRAVSLDVQCDCARCCCEHFFSGNMDELLEKKSKQLGVSKNSPCQKILFIGLQQDPVYSNPWTAPVMKEHKSMFVYKASERYGIKVIFSDDVGFPVEGYI